MIVRKLRLKHGWSQRQLAEMAGVTTRTIQRIERGQTPSVETAKALASVFEVDFSTFQPTETDMEPTTPSSNDLPTSGTHGTLSADEREAMLYAKRIKEFYEFLFTYLVILAAFLFAGMPGKVAYLVFGAIGLGLVFQGLYAFGYIKFLSPDWERKLVEKRLNRKL